MRGGEGKGPLRLEFLSARPAAQRPLTCLGGRVLLASLEGVPEQQFIAPAPRAHQNHADGASVVPHPTRGRGAKGRRGGSEGLEGL